MRSCPDTYVVFVHKIRINGNQCHTMLQIIRIDVPHIWNQILRLNFEWFSTTVFFLTINGSIIPVLLHAIRRTRQKLMIDFVEIANKSTSMSTPTFIHNKSYISIQSILIEEVIFKIFHFDFRNSVFIVPKSGVVLVFETMAYFNEAKYQNYQDLHCSWLEGHWNATCMIQNLDSIDRYNCCCLLHFLQDFFIQVSYFFKDFFELLKSALKNNQLKIG